MDDVDANTPIPLIVEMLWVQYSPSIYPLLPVVCSCIPASHDAFTHLILGWLPRTRSLYSIRSDRLSALVDISLSTFLAFRSVLSRILGEKIVVKNLVVELDGDEMTR